MFSAHEQVTHSIPARNRFDLTTQKDVIPTCRDLGIGIVAYSPLGRGFLTGQIKSRDDLAGVLLACTPGWPHVN